MIKKMVFLLVLMMPTLTSWAAERALVFPTRIEAEDSIKRAIVQNTKQIESDPKFIHLVEGFVNIISVEAVDNCKEVEDYIRCDISISTIQPIRQNVFKNIQPVYFTSQNGNWLVSKMEEQQ